ncbi:hypothetical protein ADH75_04045 [Flavonifractor plautii]|nr:hypothetical protein A4U99_13395 [Flavonifractor plautii]OXE48753.1 hypothetical protein ADH75_04045 [Flavonifractor plautii]
MWPVSPAARASAWLRCVIGSSDLYCVLSLSLPNVYQKWPGTVAVPGSFCAWHARRVYQMSTNATFCRSFVPFGTACGGNPSFFMACKGRHTPLWLKIQKEEIQMRNLKRALSLALAAIMLIGMMVVSASAVSYNDLTDKDQIVNKDAVSMLVSLGIIEGKPDGSYAPTENVDRAQMAKMLSVIMNKGVDNSALYQSVNSGLTDITSNWAKGHINYCYTTGNTAVTQDSNANVKTKVFNVSTPVDMLGKTVTMYVKKTTILADSNVYGAPVVSDVNTVIETGEKVTGGDAKDDDSLAALLKGTGLATDKATEYYHNYEEVAIDSADVDDIMNVKGAALTVIDNDNDGYVNYVISVEKSLTHVSGVSSKNETTTLYGLPGDDVIYNEDIVTTATDLTKGDVVLVVQYGGRTYVEEPKTATGEMELFNAKNKDENKNYIKVGGEEYKQDGLEVLSNINKDNPVKFLISECDDKANGVQFDAQYDFFLDDFGNIVAFREVEGAPTQYALALDSAYSINGLTTTGQIKLLLADGTSKVYDVDMDATADRFEDLANSDDNSTKDSAVETWFGSAITDDNSMDAVLKFMGSDDATAAGAKTKGYASGNLVAYTIDDDEVVTFGPAELDDGVIVNGTSKNYIKGDNYTESGKSTFFHSSQTELKADVARGDVDLRLENSSVDTHTNSYGIDEETIIYYYNGSKGYVAVGYDNMAKMIDADKAGGIDNGKVRASVVAFDDATDVAEVIVLYTDQAKFGTDAYVYVMSVYDKSGSVYTYSVIDEEGNVLQMQSKTKGMAGKLCTYTTDGDYYVLEAQADCVSNSNKTAAADVANDVGLIVTTRTKYFKVYDFDKATDLMSDDETVKQSFVSGVNDNSNTDWERYADKALVIDVENTEVDDKTAATTELTSGQYGIVVYNDDGQAEVVYVTDTYKMEVDVDAGDDDNANNDRITSTTVEGVKTASAGDYTTIAKAVANATTLPLSAEQAKNATVTITVDGSVTAHTSGIFTTAAVAENGTDSDLTNRTDDIASSKNLNNGNVIVVKTWDGIFARYSAYIVEVQ